MKHFLLLILCFLTIPLMGQNIPLGMYSVDYKLLIALHPRMANYDMVLERHLRSDIDFANMEKVDLINEQIASLSIEANRKAEKLMQDLDRLNIAISRIDNAITGNLIEFDEERQQFQGDNTRQSQMAKKSQLEVQQREIENQIVKIWDEVLNPLYLSKAQSSQIVETALNEIDALLESFSKQLGGAIIIDSDYQAIQFAPDKMSTAPVVGATPLSIRLYQSLLNSDLLGNVPEPYRKDPELARYASGMRRDIEASFDQNIATQISKSPLFAKTTGIRGRMILAGGNNMDLTRQVIESLFKKYAVRAEIASRILSQIR